MYLTVKLALLTCSVLALFSSVKAVSVTSFPLSPGVTNAACLENETLCGKGCCPYPNSVCCNETKTCCREGNVCLGSIPHCLGLKQDGAAPTLFSEKSTALRGEDCPSGMTTCYGACCPLPNAVCCPDKITCCPEGYTCGPIGSGLCNSNENAVARFLKTILSKSNGVPSTNTFNIFLRESRRFAPKAGDDCCDAWFGYICCQYPSVCTTLGCM